MATIKRSCNIFSKSFRGQLKSVLRNDFFNIICNTIILKDKPEQVPERYIKELLLENGEFAIYEGEICEVIGNNGLFVYREPTQLNLRAPNGFSTFFVDRDKCIWVGANQTRTSCTDFLDLQINKLVELEISLYQNIISSRSGDIILLKDQNKAFSLQNAILENVTGAPFIIGDKDLFGAEDLEQIQLKAEFVSDKINQIKQEIYNETLEHYGILNANSNKRERVQVGELEVSSGFAYDSIYTIIDTANRDLAEQGAKMRLVFNGALDDFTNRKDAEKGVENEEKEVNENGNDNN